MSVAITAQVPVAATAPEAASLQAGPSTGGTTEKGLVDFFAKARFDAGNGQTAAAATESVASSGDMVGKLREFIDKAHKSDMQNKATRAKQRAAAADAKVELASLDTLGSLNKFHSLSQFSPLGQFGSIGRSTTPNRYASVGGLPPGPASGSLGPDLELGGKGRVSATVDKMTDDLMDSAIHNMWTRVVMHGTNSVTKSVMTLLKGQ